MNNECKTKQTVKFGDKYFTVQTPPNREPYIEVMSYGERKKFTLNMVKQLNDLETIEGWEKLYQQLHNC